MRAVAADEIPSLLPSEARPGTATSPWLIVNTVVSADGATAVDGVSGGLGGPGDRALFTALRSIADVILVGSGTATAERYRPPRAEPGRIEERLRREQAPLPRIAVVSNRGEIDLGLPMFRPEPPAEPPLVLTGREVGAARLAELGAVADVIQTGGAQLDLRAAITLLGGEAGTATLLCEGGPVLNGLLVAEGLVDEWCITIAPKLVGGGSPRAARGPEPAGALELRLARAWLCGDELLLRYLREAERR